MHLRGLGGKKEAEFHKHLHQHRLLCPTPLRTHPPLHHQRQIAHLHQHQLLQSSTTPLRPVPIHLNDDRLFMMMVNPLCPGSERLKVVMVLMMATEANDLQMVAKVMLRDLNQMTLTVLIRIALI